MRERRWRDLHQPRRVSRPICLSAVAHSIRSDLMPTHGQRYELVGGRAEPGHDTRASVNAAWYLQGSSESQSRLLPPKCRRVSALKFGRA